MDLQWVIAQAARFLGALYYWHNGASSIEDSAKMANRLWKLVD